MDPILTLISLVVLAPVIVVVMRALLVPSISADDLLQRTDLRWPHGVQEEEPARWHPERLRTPVHR
jgi:hypothetical protein